ncbi:PfkB family carbohydrate kinase, partial [Cellulomonas massiliensis]|uniref:PfkB family carbohydrate kinase n=1 Tax=Cellulomonas massiliensis TaxID=1465811 RepID=UPI00036C34D9
MSRLRLVVVGDVLLDRDVRGTSDRLCPDAPAPVVDVVDRTQSPGGAGLAALLCADAAAVTVVAPFADDADGRALRHALAARTDVLALGHEGPTRTKTRVRVGDSSVVRVDDGGPGAPTWVDLAGVRRVLAAADAVLVSDYGAGTTRHDALRALLVEAAARLPVVWDPHPRGGDPVPGCRLVTPNLAEALRSAPDGPPDVVATGLCAAWDADAVAVTLGARGASVGRRDGAP